MELELDYRKCDFPDIEDALRAFIEKKADFIHISNINAAAFSDHFGVEFLDITSWEGDWWGKFEFEGTPINLFGSMWYGYIDIDKE